jgi:oligopeptide/dipeptide ABC transporter ATP-binding protein
LDTNTRLLDIQNLHVTFLQKTGNVQAVRGASLFVNDQGESIGIVGESGSGKSVSSLAIMQLIKQPPGEVKADRMHLRNNDMRAMSNRAKRAMRGKDIGMIFQEPMTSLDPVFTIGQQMEETITLHQNVGKKRALEIAAEMLSKVEIPNPRKTLSYYPHQLSGGMRQRAMVAMALSCNPRILIADEPTTALDVTIQAQVLQLIKDLQEELGMALIMITHDLGVIAETTDRVFVMYGGKVLEHGTVFEIFEEPAQPYTKALLRSLPDVSKERNEKLAVIEGNSPNPIHPPTGCPFHPRCPVAMDKCKEAFPPLTPISDTHYAYCWRLEE